MMALSGGLCECPTGWLDNEDKCYYFSEDTKTWKEANDLTSILGMADAWLGLTDENTKREWSWTDGSPLLQSQLYDKLKKRSNLTNVDQQNCSDSSYWLFVAK
ncbi:C-type lectin domain family 17, member A-like [Phyllopteryx taeniolatus]|uniref:C-type lectin domain family 17, member A-like n=1 Tax=Phyllopteryx taeniolatus TaxID=161469 RepID=UPI002AD4CDE2|nr:C-type lectin domain family 17, member A-like [Phyllopteryx taeniolatus]XP_061652082.1 C-type lectin domain family 17, member A-like [Phyllopteryx taeniolatus]XP_061652084.1 C-type lectin domain family 17, member A-like [Phyllopteryx taeniolatus]